MYASKNETACNRTLVFMPNEENLCPVKNFLKTIESMCLGGWLLLADTASILRDRDQATHALFWQAG